MIIGTCDVIIQPRQYHQSCNITQQTTVGRHLASSSLPPLSCLSFLSSMGAWYSYPDGIGWLDRPLLLASIWPSKGSPSIYLHPWSARDNKDARKCGGSTGHHHCLVLRGQQIGHKKRRRQEQGCTSQRMSSGSKRSSRAVEKMADRVALLEDVLKTVTNLSPIG